MDNVIELEIGEGRQDGTYAVRVLRSVTGGEPTGTLSLDIDELLAQRSLIEATVLSSSVSARRVTPVAEQPVRGMGQKLFESLFSGAVGGAYRASLGVARERGHSLRLVLRLTAPGLAALPWETLYDSEVGAYVCRKEPLVRHVPGPSSPELLTVQSPLRILGMVASPRGLPLLDVRAEQDRLHDALKPHIDAHRVELVWLDDVSWTGVHAALLQESWHILHFIGHGGFDTETDEGVLALVGPDGRADFVGASPLADLLDEAEPTPRLVVLNSCASGATGAEDIFSGTAAALVRSGIHAVAAMQFAVSDGGAIAFARGFYTAIASGRGIDDAVRSGRIGILGTGRGTLEWVTPVLYLRAGETQLFAISDGQASTAADSTAPGSPSSWGPTAPTSTAVRAEPAVPPGPRDETPPDGRGPVSAEAPVASEPASGGTPDAVGADWAKESGAAVRVDEEERSGAGRGRVQQSLPSPTWSPTARRRWFIRGAALAAVVGTVTAVVAFRPDFLGLDDSRDSSPETTVQTVIPATQVWTDAGISCSVGDTLEIAVSGTVMHEDSATGEVGPDGLTDPIYHEWNVPGLPDANTVAAIGSLDKKSPFVVGRGTTYTCERDGALFLGVNDIGVANNSGQFSATITRHSSA